MRSVIITSTGRTGTYFLYRLLSNSCSNCSVYHNSKNTTLINTFSNIYLAGGISESVLRHIWHLLKSNEIASQNKDIYVDSNNHLYALISIAPDLYPSPTVVHLIRDPRDYVRSHLNWAYSRTKSYLANFHIPFWQPNAYLVGEMKLGKWVGMSWFERYCWIWDFKNRYIQSSRNNEVPYKVFRVEDFFNNSASTFSELSEFIQIDIQWSENKAENKDLNQSTTRKIPHWSEWPNRDCAVLDSWCHRQMIQHGYGMEEEWIEKVKCGYMLIERD